LRSLWKVKAATCSQPGVGLRKMRMTYYIEAPVYLDATMNFI